MKKATKIKYFDMYNLFIIYEKGNLLLFYSKLIQNHTYNLRRVDWLEPYLY
jgi:hypothetical protein